MPYPDYAKYFSEHHVGPFHAVRLLTLPTKPTRDVNISDSQQQTLKDIILAGERGQNRILALHDNTTAERALIVNAIAYKLAKPVCFVSAKQFVLDYTQSTQKNISNLLARGETSKWVFVIEDADLLFDYQYAGQDEKDLTEQAYSYLLKLMSLYPGLIVLSLNTQACLEKARYAVVTLTQN